MSVWAVQNNKVRTCVYIRCVCMWVDCNTNIIKPPRKHDLRLGSKFALQTSYDMLEEREVLLPESCCHDLILASHHTMPTV